MWATNIFYDSYELQSDRINFLLIFLYIVLSIVSPLTLNAPYINARVRTLNCKIKQIFDVGKYYITVDEYNKLITHGFEEKRSLSLENLETNVYIYFI